MRRENYERVMAIREELIAIEKSQNAIARSKEDGCGSLLVSIRASSFAERYFEQTPEMTRVLYSIIESNLDADKNRLLEELETL
jgi:hypothetical protein